MSGATKPLPQPDPVTAPFWASVRAHAMQIQRCRACGQHIFYPRGLCPHCFASDLEWVQVSGQGTVYAFTIVHRHPNPAFQADVPYIVALVELAEGVRLLGNLTGIAPDPAVVKVGLPVEIAYDDVSPDISLPVFRPRG